MCLICQWCRIFRGFDRYVVVSHFLYPPCNAVIVDVERWELGTVHGCYEGGREIETLSGSREDVGVISCCFLVISLYSISISIY
jgi:hypothetical protein